MTSIPISSDRRLSLRRIVAIAPHVVVGCAALLWSFLIAARALALHRDYGTGRFDLGNMTQAVWSTAHGRFLETTMAGGDQMSRLAVHVDPILAVFAPLSYVLPIPETLLVVQSVALAAGAFPVFWLARKHLESEWAAVLCAAAYLLNPWIAWQALFDFHAVELAIPLLLFALWFADTRRWPAFAAVTVAALLTHELIGLTVCALGIWIALRLRERRVGIGVAVGGVLWTVICLKVIIPVASSGSDSPFYGHFESVGGSPGGLVKTLFTDPVAIAGQVGSLRDIAYLTILLMPVAGLAIWAPTVLLIAAPQLLVNLLADPEAMTSPTFQYSAAVMPFVIAAAVMGLRRFDGPRRRIAGASFVAATSLLCFLALGPVTDAPVIAGDSRTENDPSTTHLEAVRRAIALVPTGAPVTATNLLGGHLSERERIFSVPVLRDAEWIVVDSHESFVPAIPGRTREGLRPRLIRRFVARVQADPAWTRAFAEDGVLVFRRDES